MEFVTIAPGEATALDALPDFLRGWVTQRFDAPTISQRMAWPILSQGRNLLLSAPTGTGKTLAATLPILGELIQSPSYSPSVRCLYVSPLKALVNDLSRSLHAHLIDIGEPLPEGTLLPGIRTRTGDTSADDRRLLWEDPPDVLLTTPESLAVLLSRPEADDLFSDLRWVIIDEIHALAGNKRGADLTLSVERLERITSSEHELQRIGLSATSTPLTETARYLVGTDRDCVIAPASQSASLDLSLVPLTNAPGFLRQIIDHLQPELTRDVGQASGRFIPAGENFPQAEETNQRVETRRSPNLKRVGQSILVFTNTRNLAERLAWALRHRFPQWNEQIAVHHSALAATRREEVEQQFKQGELRVLVCSTSLELGIDVGAVDLVVLVHPPGGVVRLLQRVGRAGHSPGQLRRGIIFTSTTAELLEASVTNAAARLGQCEHLEIARHPLDVLCQQLLGMAMNGEWNVEDAWAMVRRAAPYSHLERADFDDCLAYLSGRPSWASTEEDWVPSRLTWHEDAFSIVNDRTAKALRRNLGTILTENSSDVIQETAEGEERLIGQVDEAFAERLQPGDQFLLDGRCLQLRRMELGNRERPGTSHVIVHEVVGRPQTPRWIGEGPPLSTALAQRLYLLRARAAEALRESPSALRQILEVEYELSGNAIVELLSFFEQQEAVSEIPEAGVLLIEGMTNDFGADYYLHTPLNRAGNDALARVITLRLSRVNRQCETLIADLGLAVNLRDRGELLTPEDWRTLLDGKEFEADLRDSLAGSFSLRSRFQRIAYTGLMLLRHPIGRQRRVGGRDWAERRLCEQVQATHPGFVLLRQAEREVQEEVVQLESAKKWLKNLPSVTLRCRWLNSPSPFVAGWTQILEGESDPMLTAEESLQRFYESLMGAE